MRRLKTTIVIESENQADLTEALALASQLAKGRVMLMSFGPKKPNGARVSVKTTIMKKAKHSHDSIE